VTVDARFPVFRFMCIRPGSHCGYADLVTGTHEALPDLDITTPNVARMYDYYLGGKDNISQVVSGLPHSALTVAIQPRHDCYSNTSMLTVRGLVRVCLGADVRFGWRGFLTPA
jgi:hypothetical protein